ncbi:MAG: pyridoxal phosphate-dependent aminotransferase [Candidatus Dormiibacterota bacterium]
MADQREREIVIRRTFTEEGTQQRYQLMELAQRFPDLIALGRGDPDLPTPEHIVSAADTAIDRGVDAVTDPGGLPELRQAISAKLIRENAVPVHPDDGVVVTTGAQEAMYLAVQALLRPGDEILVPDPRYTSYDVAIEMAGAKMVMVPTSLADGFQLHADAMERLITPRTRCILVISPSNPTAGVLSERSLREVCDLAIRHDLTLISDEIYEKLLYDDARHVSAGSLPGMAERTVTINGFSKTFCMTGWRLGYLAGPSRFMAEARQLKELMSVCAPTVSQWAGLAALSGPMDFLKEYLKIYSRRRKIVLSALDRLGFKYGRPMGAFYVFVDASSIGVRAFDLARRLLEEAHVLIFPGTGFGEEWSDYLRISWVQPEQEIGEAFDRIERALLTGRV